jgi:hypothetical protein
MRPSQARKLMAEIERSHQKNAENRERVGIDDNQRPSVIRLLFMVLWAKITGR